MYIYIYSIYINIIFRERERELVHIVISGHSYFDSKPSEIETGMDNSMGDCPLRRLITEGYVDRSESLNKMKSHHLGIAATCPYQPWFQ